MHLYIIDQAFVREIMELIERDLAEIQLLNFFPVMTSTRISPRLISFFLGISQKIYIDILMYLLLIVQCWRGKYPAISLFRILD